jgi:heme/copper-type cytochrome/quinol oxidase subunit 4
LNVAAIFIAALLTRAKAYVRENWGAPFIMGFMLLLVVAAASVSMGLAEFADEVAVYAYYALLVGIILQLVCFLKCDKRSGGPDQ